MRKTFGKIKLYVQKINAIIAGKKQYKINITTKVCEEKIIDRWCVIEAPYKLRAILYTRVLRTIGRCRLIA